MAHPQRIVVNRKSFKHWIKLLDYLTQTLNTTKAVKKLYSVDGMEAEHVSGLI